jgi:methionine synthase II (cobalamin-independent)
MIRKLETLKASLELIIDETNDLIKDAPTDADFHWHVGYRSALKEVLEAIKEEEE